MKKLSILILCLVAANARGQQKNNVFHVIDSETAKPVPSVSITIVQAALSITTEKDGIFVIPGDLEKMRDTIILYTQNYSTIKIPLNKLSTMDTIGMKKLTTTNNTIKLAVDNDTLLNNYNRLDVGNYVGLHIGNAEFKYLQIAQRFEAPRAGSVLKKVTINRLAFYVHKGIIDKYGNFDERQYPYSELEHTKFRIRIYDADPITGNPGKDLCTQIIEVKSTDQKQLATNLTNYNIQIPNKTFFVAVEWLRDYLSMGYVHIDDAIGKRKGHVNYRPAIGLSPSKGDKLNIWALNLNHEWKPYTYHSPDFTDLAIKAVVGF
jgi:5-hydroxyisourate hydrolase-like protein (transthyretin family)